MLVLVLVKVKFSTRCAVFFLPYVRFSIDTAACLRGALVVGFRPAVLWLRESGLVTSSLRDQRSCESACAACSPKYFACATRECHALHAPI